MVRSTLTLFFVLLGCCCISLYGQQTNCSAKKISSCAAKMAQSKTVSPSASVLLVSQQSPDRQNIQQENSSGKAAKVNCDPSQCKPQDCDPKNCDPSKCDLSKCETGTKASLVGNKANCVPKSCLPAQCEKMRSKS